MFCIICELIFFLCIDSCVYWCVDEYVGQNDMQFVDFNTRNLQRDITFKSRS